MNLEGVSKQFVHQQPNPKDLCSKLREKIDIFANRADFQATSPNL
jgi:hypothetical protein